MRSRGPYLALGAVVAAQWAAVLLLARRVGSGDAGLLLAFLQALTLLPVAVAAVYGIAAALAGPRLGVFAAAVWALGPYALIPFVDPRYEERYLEGVLAVLGGLTDEPELPALVLLVVAAALAVRVAQGGRAREAALAGLAAGAACAVETSSLVFLPAPVLAFLVARRPRVVAPFALAVLPGLALLWIAGDGLGTFSGAGTWSHLHTNELLVREYSWSVRIPEWLLLAGLVGVARRSLPVAALLAAWFGAFLLVRGTDPALTIQNVGFLRELVPALPAFALLAAAVPLLLPPLPPLRGWFGRRVVGGREGSDP